MARKSLKSLVLTAVVLLFHCAFAMADPPGWRITQLTNNILYDGSPQISGTNVVWEVYDGNDGEIFFYNGTTTTQLTNYSFYDYDPQISGANVVWWGEDGSDWEIFMAVPCLYSISGDLNDDCKVDFYDVATFASNWLIDCIEEPENPACVPK